MTYKTTNKTEQQEQKHLEFILDKLQQAIDFADTAVTQHVKEVQENKNYLWENKSGMDHVEKVQVRQSITQIAMTGESALAKKKRLLKLKQSPYFGRIDFKESNDAHPYPIYIGIHAFYDQQENSNLIHDWRAPVSSMFYDFELGDVFFDSPSGKMEGKMTLKRQYRIRSGKMEFMLESSLNIHDDLLQKELSQNASEKMKNIVATIQRDQNAIIRNENSRALIIQGVAGSGKTSIALHRIAFLLYRFKETISSEDILIISPNKVFGDYISNVLPELGEEKIQETSMEELADELLDKKYKFQTFFEQVSHLLTKTDEDFKTRIQFKSGFDFINKLNEYVFYIERAYFNPTDIVLRRNPIPAAYIHDKYRTYARIPLLKRFAVIVDDIIKDLHFYNQYEATTADRNDLKKQIEGMFRLTNLRKLYQDFYQWMGKPELFKPAKGSVYEYADVFPLIFLKIALEGVRVNEKVKHLVVDEMQDYTPLQYQILDKLFPCNKTILGDSNQSVNPYSSSNADLISRIFPYADCMKMNKSYRSTVEIVEFAQRIRINPDLEVVERHGKVPAVIHCKNEEDEMTQLSALMHAYESSAHTSLGIICKTQVQADKIYDKLQHVHKQLCVLNAQSASFSNGIIVTTAHLAKGLEFDQVIVPFAGALNYKSDTDRQMFYVACTRAMHELHLTYTGKQTVFIAN